MNVSGNNQSLYATINDYAVFAAIPMLMIGFIANSFVLYVIVSDSYFRKTTYYLIRINLISDITSTFTGSISFAVIIVDNDNYYTGAALCRSLFYVIMTSYSISVFTLCLISIDRYFAIIKPYSRFYRKHKHRFLTFTLIIAFTISFGICTPSAIFTDVYPDHPEFCDFPGLTISKSFYLIFMVIILYLFPAGVLLFTYGNIVRHQMTYVRPGYVNVSNYKEDQLRKKKFIKTLITITLSFLLSTWPFFATGVGMAVTGKSMRQIGDTNIILYALAFASFSSTVGVGVTNPFLYLKFDQNINRKSRKVILKLCHYSSSDNVQEITVSHVPAKTSQIKAL